MQVVITREKLVASNACDVYLKSPEWDAEQGALVYSNWDASVARLLSTRRGIKFLGFLVESKLVPMTTSEFNARRAEGR